MSAGPATKMYEALRWIEGEGPTWPETKHDAMVAAEVALEDDITSATLEAMDAAAEVMSARHPEEAAFPLRCRDDGEGLYIRDRNLDYFFLHSAEQAQLLRELFTRFIQRRKEAADHA